MPRIRSGLVLAAIVVAASSAAAQGAAGSSAPSPARQKSDAVARAKARADSARLPYTEADVDFMSGMISHHAQAIVMAKWAPTHGASSAVQTLCATRVATLTLIKDARTRAAEEDLAAALLLDTIAHARGIPADTTSGLLRPGHPKRERPQRGSRWR